MKVLPVTQNNGISYKGKLAPKMNLMIGDIQVGINNVYSGAINKNTTFRFSTSKQAMTNKLANIYDNLNTIMERFGHSCELTFEQSEKSQMQRFYIENKSSSYKMVVTDTKMPRKGYPNDIEALEQVAESLEKINPYEANMKFIIGKNSKADEKDFIPDADYVILEDRLIKDL